MDGVNQHVIATVARLRAAGLYDLVERTTKKLDLLPKHVLPLGEVTNGHRAVWHAVHAKGRSVADVARLFGFPAEIVGQALCEKVPTDGDAPAPVTLAPKVPKPKVPPAPKAKPLAKAPKPAKPTTPRASASLPPIPDLEVPEQLLTATPQPSRFNIDRALMACLDIARAEGAIDELVITAERHRVPLASIVGSLRMQNVVRARAEAIWRLRHVCGLSANRIGDILSKRDHTTIGYHLAKFKPDAALLALLPKREAA